MKKRGVGFAAEAGAKPAADDEAAESPKQRVGFAHTVVSAESSSPKPAPPAPRSRVLVPSPTARRVLPDEPELDVPRFLWTRLLPSLAMLLVLVGAMEVVVQLKLTSIADSPSISQSDTAFLQYCLFAFLGAFSLVTASVLAAFSSAPVCWPGGNC